LRKALGAQANGKPYIETVAKRGYYFAAKVREVRDDAASASATVDGLGTPTVPSPASPPRPARHGRARAHTLAYAALLAGVSVGVAYLGTRGNRAAAPAEAARRIRSMAVLPFRALREVKGDDYLGLGLADALITKLGNLRRIDVRPTGAVRRYAGPGQGSVTAGRELGVDAVLEGSFQQDGDRLRVTVQLVSVRDASPMWADTFDTRATDIFGVEDTISWQVARALLSEVSDEERRRLAKRHTTSPEAHQLYLMSRYFWNKRTDADHQKALEYAQRAIAIDPAYGLAYAALADSYALGSDAGANGGRDAAMHKAKAAALKALEIDDTLAEAHTSLAYVLMQYEWNWREAEHAFRRAIAISPGYATAHHWYAYLLTILGRHDSAIVEIRRAQELDPLSIIITTDTGEIHYWARRYDRAEEFARKALELDPDFMLAHRLLGWTLMQTGRNREALAALERARKLSGDRADILASLGVLYGRARESSRARQMLAALERAPDGSPYGLAMVHASLGETERALTWLDRAYQQRTALLMGVDPFLDPVRQEPRFVALVHRVGLRPPAGFADSTNR
jgi:TolB-like protein/Flp pilus assembly protein TadD